MSCRVRKRINWFYYLFKFGTEQEKSYFRDLLNKYREGKKPSFNRLAYAALRSCHSTTTIDELCEKLGI